MCASWRLCERTCANGDDDGPDTETEAVPENASRMAALLVQSGASRGHRHRIGTCPALGRALRRTDVAIPRPRRARGASAALVALSAGRVRALSVHKNIARRPLRLRGGGIALLSRLSLSRVAHTSDRACSVRWHGRRSSGSSAVQGIRAEFAFRRVPSPMSRVIPLRVQAKCRLLSSPLFRVDIFALV